MAGHERKGEEAPDQHDKKRYRAHRVDVEAEDIVHEAPAVSPEPADDDPDCEAEERGEHADEQRHPERSGEEQPGVGDRLQVDVQESAPSFRPSSSDARSARSEGPD